MLYYHFYTNVNNTNIYFVFVIFIFIKKHKITKNINVKIEFLKNTDKIVFIYFLNIILILQNFYVLYECIKRSLLFNSIQVKESSSILVCLVARSMTPTKRSKCTFNKVPTHLLYIYIVSYCSISAEVHRTNKVSLHHVNIYTYVMYIIE